MKYSSYQSFEWRSMTIVLFLIATLQVMIFGFFQTSDDLLGPDSTSEIFALNVFFYSVMLITAVIHPFIMRRFSLKIALLLGLLFDLLAVTIMWLNTHYVHSLLLLFVNFFFVAVAVVSVINCLVTYLVIQYPRSLGPAMIGLFLFANIGMLIETALLDALSIQHFYFLFCFAAFCGILLAMYFVIAKFFNPQVPKHLDRFRRGTLIWKELHYRLVLFLFVMLCYGLVETLFSVWSGAYLAKFMTAQQAQDMITYFWASMVLGQLLLLAPMYFFSARKIFSFNILFSMCITLFLIQQTHLLPITFGMIAAGFGCSIIFPMLLAFLEKEVLDVCTVSNVISPMGYIETGISLMIGAYLTGTGVISLIVLTTLREASIVSAAGFHWTMLLLGVIGLLATYLNWSSAGYIPK